MLTDIIISKERVMELLKGIPDPEIPVLSILDLGIVRNVALVGNRVNVSITPTYSGCPAMHAIETEIKSVLDGNGLSVSIDTVYAPAWTTDWISDDAKEKLRKYGIAPPSGHASGSAKKEIHCPRCNSAETELVSLFGSTACKSLYRCLTCREPFDYFKCH